MAHKVTVSPGFYLLLPAAFLLLPLRWILGWALAVTVHEVGHYVALQLCKIPVPVLEITPFGIRMHTGMLTNKETLLCALAGPLCSLLLTALSRFLPCTAVCTFLQAVFNLLPVYPLDGGRALRAVLTMLFKTDSAVYAVEKGIFLLVIGLFLYFILRLKLGIFPATLLIGIFTQKFLANRRRNGYNRGENDF